MPTVRRITFLVISLCAAFVEGTPLPAQQREPAELLQAIRGAMAARELPRAAELLAEAEQIEAGEPFAVERERLRLLHGYLEQFWQGVDAGARRLQGADELVIGEVRTAVVEYERGQLVLRVAGQNRRYSLQTMPAKLALTLAEQVMPPNSPNNRVIFGAFLLLDARGDRTLAAQHWRAAEQAKVDVAALLPELESLPPSTLPVPLPNVTPVMRKVLAPAGWSLRRAAERGRPERKPVGEFAEQNEAGRLQAALPDDAAPAELVFGRTVSGNFGCRVILENLPEGESFGLFSAEGAETLCRIPLPAGSVMVELARVRGVWTCRLNQKEVEVESAGGVSGSAAGLLGVTLSPGGACTISWFELQTR